MADIVNTNQFRNGMHIEHRGAVWRIVEFQHVKPGKGGAFVRTKLKNLESGAVVEDTFRAGEKFPRVHTEVKNATVLGRGGAGFPAGVKWGLTPQGKFPRYLVVNGDESEPGTYKDRLLMERDPHQLIEGCLIACYAAGLSQCFLYIRGEMALAQERVAAALNAVTITRLPARVAGALTTAYITGDSTVQTYDPTAYAPQAGWGQMIDRFFADDIAFANHAIGGRSSKNFITQGRLDEVLRDGGMSAGDFVRRCKQVVDLLGQVASSGAEPEVARAARRASDAMLRGVVAADRLD